LLLAYKLLVILPVAGVIKLALDRRRETRERETKLQT
jgi:hypothetical protein